MIFIDINGKYVPLEKLPCFKCEYRYSYVCPQCNWNKDGKYNTYGRAIMSKYQEALEEIKTTNLHPAFEKDLEILQQAVKLAERYEEEHKCQSI